MTFKFNGGYGAVLCDYCHVIVASGKDSFDLLFRGVPEHKYDIIDINDRLKVMSNTECFCCEECRDKYYSKRIDRSLIIKKD